MGKGKDAMKKVTQLAATSAVTAVLMGFTPAQATGNMFHYSPLGTGAEVRTVLTDMNEAAKNNTEHKCGGMEKKSTKKGEKSSEAKCGEGKCGEKSNKKSEMKKEKATKASEAKCGEGKCGEGKCGEKSSKKEKKEANKASEAKCGEGKCGN
ncbi:MAG: hypothetical protein Kow00108_21050 [Calditrichia bacterium]